MCPWHIRYTVTICLWSVPQVFVVSTLSVMDTYLSVLKTSIRSNKHGHDGSTSPDPPRKTGVSICFFAFSLNFKKYGGHKCRHKSLKKRKLGI